MNAQRHALVMVRPGHYVVRAVATSAQQSIINQPIEELRKMTTNTTLTHFIAVGSNNGWGRAKTEAAAIRNMHNSGARKASAFNVYHVTEGTYVNELGGLNRPKDDVAPVLVREHRPAVKAVRHG